MSPRHKVCQMAAASTVVEVSVPSTWLQALGKSVRWYQKETCSAERHTSQFTLLSRYLLSGCHATKLLTRCPSNNWNHGLKTDTFLDTDTFLGTSALQSSAHWPTLARLLMKFVGLLMEIYSIDVLWRLARVRLPRIVPIALCVPSQAFGANVFVMSCSSWAIEADYGSVYIAARLCIYGQDLKQLWEECVRHCSQRP